MRNFIANIYAVERTNERANTLNWEKHGNKMLLWHGTRAENLVGILQTGFRIAPKEATRTGSMFGDGIYFADVFSKSYNYTSATHSIHLNNRGFYGHSRHTATKRKYPKRYMFLCEVMLGNQLKLVQPSPVTGLPNQEFQSALGYGQTGPNPLHNVYLSNGSLVPLGELQHNKRPEWIQPTTQMTLNYNEYIVYDTTQVRIKYIIECRDL